MVEYKSDLKMNLPYLNQIELNSSKKTKIEKLNKLNRTVSKNEYLEALEFKINSSR